MDTSFLIFYSIGLFISGSLGDNMNSKYLLILSYVFVTVIASTIALSSLYGYNSPLLFFFMFAVNGFMQSCGWPACSTIFANWFGKNGRGAIVGFWQSCGNFGNIVGAILTSFFTSTLLMNWQMSYLYVS